METNQKSTECCPPFEPAKWDDKEHLWENKRFVKGAVKTFLYMPLNFGPVIRKLDSKVSTSNASFEDNLCLSDHTSLWNMNIYVAVNKEITYAHNIIVSGKFYSKVYEGNFNKTGEWCKDFDNVLKSKNLKMSKLYMWYTTCPKCAKKYGKNYVVLFGKID